jgi:hypothetical protein
MTLEPGTNDEVTHQSAGGSDLFLAKYAANGSLAWTLSLGAASTDDGTHVVAMANDSILVAGNFRGSVTFGDGEANETTLSAQTSLAFVALYNADGTLAWARSPVLFSPRGLAGYRNGSYSLLTEGDKIHRFNADGSVAWSRTVTGMRGSAVSGFQDGSLVVGGDFLGPITFGTGEPNETTLVPMGNQDIFVARYNPDGTIAWASQAGGNQTGLALNSITSLPDGACVIGGYFFESPTFGVGEANETILMATPLVFNTNLSSQDLYIARYEADGTLGLAKGGGGGANDGVNAVAGFPDCSYVATGMFAGANVVFGEGDARETSLSDAATQQPDGVDMFVARYNADGGY